MSLGDNYTWSPWLNSGYLCCGDEWIICESLPLALGIGACAPIPACCAWTSYHWNTEGGSVGLAFHGIGVPWLVTKQALKWGESSGTMVEGILGVLSLGEKLSPVSLIFRAIGSQEAPDFLVGLFYLSVRLGTVTGCQTHCYPQFLHEADPDPRCALNLCHWSHPLGYHSTWTHGWRDVQPPWMQWEVPEGE